MPLLAQIQSKMRQNRQEQSRKQTISQQAQPIQSPPASGEILPKQQVKEVHTQDADEMDKISSNQPHEQGDLEAIEEGAVGRKPKGSMRNEQVPTHYTPVERLRRCQ